MESGRSPMPRRILAIDDDPVSLAVAAVLLEAEGCEVLQAESGEQALDLLAGPDRPDCIIADLRMPSLAGTALAARLRQSAPDALLLAMSATPPAHVDGYDGVLRKPLHAEALRTAFAVIDQEARSPASTDTAPNDASAGDSPDPGILDSHTFDRLSRAMPPAALEEVIDAFLQDSAMRLQSMRTADPETTCRQAHTVKGAAAMVGATQVAIVAAAVEAGIDHYGDRQRKLDELEVSLRRTKVILKERLRI